MSEPEQFHDFSDPRLLAFFLEKLGRVKEVSQKMERKLQKVLNEAAAARPENGQDKQATC